MQVARRRALRSVLQISSRTRLPYSPRNSNLVFPARNWICHQCRYYHPTARLRNTTSPDHTESATPPTPKEQDGAQKPEQSGGDESRSAAEAEGYIAVKNATGGDGSDPDQPDKRPTPRTTTTRTRVTRKSSKLKEEFLPKINLPEWFLERAVFLPEELDARESRLEVSDRYGVELPAEEEDGSVEEPGSHNSGEPSKGSGSGGQGPSKDIAVEEPMKVSDDPVKEVLVEEAEPANVAEKPMKEVRKTKSIKSSKSVDQSPETKHEAASMPEPEPESSPGPNAEPEIVFEKKEEPKKAKPQISFFTPSMSMENKYGLSPAVWAEISATVKANLLLPKNAFNQTRVARYLDCVLLFPQTPETNGTYFLDAVSEDIARQLGATLIRIDAEDVAEIAGDYIETPAVSSKPSLNIPSSIPQNIRTLGYDAQLLHPNNRIPAEEEEVEEEEEGESDGDEEGESANAEYEDPSKSYRDTSSLTISPLFKFLSMNKSLSSVIRLGQGETAAIVDLSPNMETAQEPRKDENPKLNAVLELMLDSGNKKRETLDSNSGRSASPESEFTAKGQFTNRTIVQIRDFKELTANAEGKNFLNIIRKLVYQRRLEGREIMILGNSATLEHGTEITSNYLRQLQFSVTPTGKVERMIVVPPQPWTATRDLLERDRKARIREINIRHLKEMITRRSGEDGHAVVLEIPKDWHFDNVPKVPTSSDWVWDIDHVHRLCLATIGSIPTPLPTEAGPRLIGPADVAQGVRLLKQSDRMKVTWATLETKYVEEQEAADIVEPTPEEARAAKIERISRKCNKHEKKLLGGVIDASGITTGFDQVRAAPETVDALKTLTSLSLLRPEAFSYGVLATDRIPGVLLYGPPGTGKTLLAKAVAKEGGATVLEVSGSEVYDMYVGEGEKNVKAIFSLAKKLSPCVVFIDEADAIFGARTGHHQRTSHRELINQFLKEWDGVAKMSAFIMVATNRPFDLDDAVLRRLPRRILIDLPTAEDRLEILKIHLAGEDLHTDVDLAAIAADSRTNLYSGSDLKNVAVAAALAAVRDEEAIYKETKEYPEKRLLKSTHFEQALSEITASISDDMGSLGMIRKFDEKYGDKRGKKKKTNKWGFGSAARPVDEVKERGTGRVRN